MGAILHLPQGALGSAIDTADATAQNNDVRDGKIFYARGQRLVGNMPTISSATYIPSLIDQEVAGNGYLNGNITIKGDGNLIPANIKNGVTIFGVTGTHGGIDTLLSCTGKTSAAAIVSAYSDKIEVSSDGNFATWSALAEFNFQTNPVGAVYTDPDGTGYVAGVQYDDGNNSTPNRSILFIEPIQISEHTIVKYKYYVSTWINPTAQLKFVSASSLAEAKTKLANNNVALSVDIPCGNNLNNVFNLKEIESFVPGDYYICYVQPSDAGGNNAILSDLQIIQL